MTPATLDRDALEQRVTDLRRQRGDALAAGEKFDHQLIAEAVRDLEAADDAAASVARTAVTTATEARRKYVADQWAKADAAYAAYLATAGRLEKEVEALGSTLRELQRLRRELTNGCNAARPGSAPMSLDEHETDLRISRFIADRVFRRAENARPNSWASLEWTTSLDFRSTQLGFAESELFQTEKALDLAHHPLPIVHPIGRAPIVETPIELEAEEIA